MNPADGYTYTPVELDAIAHLPVESAVDLRVRRIKYFQYVGDNESRDLLLRATVADVIDNPLQGLLDYDAPFLADIEDRIVIGEEHPE